MKINGAIIKEQGQTFAIVLVKQSVLTSSQKDSVAESLKTTFGNIPIVLAAQDSRGNFKYYGRQDIARFLSKIHPSQIPWRTYTIS